jgi:hypothetical protein
VFSVAYPALQYFSTSPQKWHNIRNKNYWTWNVCFDFLHNFCVKSHSKKWARYGQKYTSVFTWSTVILCNFNETWIFSSYFRKNPRTSNFAKIRPVGVKLFKADTSCYLQTGMTQLITLLAILQVCQKQALSVSVYPFHYAIWPLEIPLKTLYSLTL